MKMYISILMPCIFTIYMPTQSKMKSKNAYSKLSVITAVENPSKNPVPKREYLICTDHFVKRPGTIKAMRAKKNNASAVASGNIKKNKPLIASVAKNVAIIVMLMVISWVKKRFFFCLFKKWTKTILNTTSAPAKARRKKRIHMP